MSKNQNLNPSQIPPAHSATSMRSTRWIAMLLAGVLGVALFAGTAGAILYNDITGTVKGSVIDTSHLNATAQSEEQSEADAGPIDSFEGRPVNLLVMGTDARVGQRDIVNPEDTDESMRADTTLIVHLSADRQSATVVSIPRDIWMLIPECQLSDGSVSYEQWGQFNWAFFFGSGGGTDSDAMAGAIACTEKTVEDMTGINFDGYAVFDFNGFASMIEALGGVEICLDEELYDPDYLAMAFPAGCNVMDGITATQFARVRHVGDGSDMQRIQRQQNMIGAIVKKALNTSMLTNMPSLYQFLTATLNNAVISPSLANINSSLGLVSSLKGIDPANIRFVTMPVLTADFNMYRNVPKEPLDSELWASLINGTDLPPGIVYQNMDGEYFTVGENGESIPGGSPRTDDEIGGIPGWDAYRYDEYIGGNGTSFAVPTWGDSTN
ncbi:LCP family protein [Actinomycetaceae bacterium MB13-C1-2]|nr:LCP family protein [Actinomycetaceae bacterium MB13-C1-2]